MKILVINGPNLNLTGRRQPEIYGSRTMDDIIASLRDAFTGVSIDYFQSNCEGAIIDAFQKAYHDGVDGSILNPGAYTHTSYAIHDAIQSVSIPTVEVHISDVTKREAFRQVSYVREACIATVAGHGFRGYLEAMDLLLAAGSHA